MNYKAVIIVALLLAVSAPLVALDDSDANTEVTPDGTQYGYSTWGIEHDTYKATLYSVETSCEVLYVSTTLEGYNVKEIAAGAFDGVPSKTIVIPEQVRSIDTDAFTNCPFLENIYFMGDRPEMDDGVIPAGVTVYTLPGASGWDGTGSIQVVTTDLDGSQVEYAVIAGEAISIGYTPSPDGDVTIASSAGGFPVRAVGPYMFGEAYSEDGTNHGEVTDVRHVKVSDGVREVRERAFYYCTGLEGVELPSSVTCIMDEAFRYSDHLSAITIPENVEYIGFEAFRNTSSIGEVTIPDATTFVGEGAFKISGAERVTVGSGVTVLPDNTFAFMENLREIEFRGDVTSMGEYQFQRDASLEWVELPDTVGSIGAYSFMGCGSLMGLDLGSSLTGLSKQLFYQCGSLEEVYVPATVGTVGENVFYRCDSLTDVYFLGERPEMGDDPFHRADPTVHCTEANADSWRGFDGIVVGGIPYGPEPPAEVPEQSPDDGPDTVVYIASAVAAVLLIALVAAVLIRKNHS